MGLRSYIETGHRPGRARDLRPAHQHLQPRHAAARRGRDPPGQPRGRRRLLPAPDREPRALAGPGQPASRRHRRHRGHGRPGGRGLGGDGHHLPRPGRGASGASWTGRRSSRPCSTPSEVERAARRPLRAGARRGRPETRAPSDAVAHRQPRPEGGEPRSWPSCLVRDRGREDVGARTLGAGGAAELPQGPRAHGGAVNSVEVRLRASPGIIHAPRAPRHLGPDRPGGGARRASTSSTSPPTPSAFPSG